MERKIKPIYNIGRTFCIEYLLWNKNSQTFSVCRQFQAKFLVGLQIFLGKYQNKNGFIKYFENKKKVDNIFSFL